MRKLEKEFSFAGFDFPKYVWTLPKGPWRKRLEHMRKLVTGGYYGSPTPKATGCMFYLESDFMPDLRWKWCDEAYSRIRHKGCYCYEDGCGDTIRGLVMRLPNNRGFLAGWSMGKGMSSYVDYDVFLDEVDAAQCADSMAKNAAEREREYQAKWEAERRCCCGGGRGISARRACSQARTADVAGRRVSGAAAGRLWCAVPDDPTRWIRTPAQLDELVAELAGVRAIGLDTEADSLHHYAEQVCLIQLTAYRGASWLIDPLAVPDLAPLAPILADPTVVEVVHGGDNDVTSLRRDFGFTFRTIFDTAIAARLLGDTEVGLQALVRAELGVELSKGSQRDYWSKRPLTAKQEAYALADVAHLMALATRLTARLAEAGRTEWAREEFAALASLVPAPSTRTEPDGSRRIKGSAGLSRRQQAVLRELYVWREARPAAADRPPFKIVGPEGLLGLAEAAPTTGAEVARALASFPRQVEKQLALLHTANQQLVRRRIGLQVRNDLVQVAVLDLQLEQFRLDGRDLVFSGRKNGH